jgi:hypothetical protein
MAGSASFGMDVDVRDFIHFGEALAEAAAMVELETTAKLHTASEVVVERAKSTIAPFSQSIPGTIHALSDGAEIRIEADGVLAGLFDLGNRGGSEGTFKHPVFAGVTVVDQPMHPFLGVSLDAEGDEIERRMLEVVDEAVGIAIK